MLKLSKLEIFTVVAHEGSFSAAGERLHLSQPAVSRHIQELEEQLGIRLFKRLRRGVELTNGGKILQQYTEQILRLVAEAEVRLTDVRQLLVGQVRIGGTPGVTVYLLPKWTRQFQNEYQNLLASLHTGVTTQVIEEVLNARTDLGLVEGELEGELERNERLQICTLQSIALHVVVGQSHPWWGIPTIEAHQLHNQAFITRQKGSKTRSWFDKVLGERGIFPHIVAESDNPEAIKEWVMSGMGFSIMPSYSIERHLQSGFLHRVQLRDLILQRELKLLWDKSRPLTPVALAFLHFLSQQFPTLLSLIPPLTEDLLE